MKVSVKFCGHCAPRMDMWDLYEGLQKACAQIPGGIQFVFYMNDPDGDILLVLNACQAACASFGPFDGKVIRVSPGQIDHWPVPEEEMTAALRTILCENS